MKKLLVLAAKNYEDIEMIGTLDILSREKIEYDIFSVNDNEYEESKFNVILKTKKLSNLDLKNDLDKYFGLFIPGGASHDAFIASEKLKEIIVNFKNNNKLLSAICAGPGVLHQAGVITDEKVTSNYRVAQIPSNTGNNVEVDGQFVTAKGMGDTFDFAYALAKEIKANYLN